jgi:RNA polymerase sigma-70 factor (ECF subfamily)
MSTSPERTAEAPEATFAAALAVAPAGPPAPRAEPEIEDAVRGLVAGGDHHGAVAILMSAYGDAVFTHARRLVSDRHIASDVRQQTFLEAFRDLGSFSGRSSFRTWLLGIATHRGLDAVRRIRRDEQRTVSHDELDAVAPISDDAADPTARVDEPRRIRALEDCLRGLSDEVRATVLMRFLHGMTYEDIAHTSGHRPGALHARVARALPVLRRCLEGKGMAP